MSNHRAADAVATEALEATAVATRRMLRDDIRWHQVERSLRRRGIDDQGIDDLISAICITKFEADKRDEWALRIDKREKYWSELDESVERLANFFTSPVDEADLNRDGLIEACRSIDWMRRYIRAARSGERSLLFEQLSPKGNSVPPKAAFQRMLLEKMNRITGGPMSELVASATDILFNHDGNHPVTKVAVDNAWQRQKRRREPP